MSADVFDQQRAVRRTGFADSGYRVAAINLIGGGPPGNKKRRWRRNYSGSPIASRSAFDAARKIAR